MLAPNLRLLRSSEQVLALLTGDLKQFKGCSSKIISGECKVPMIQELCKFLM